MDEQNLIETRIFSIKRVFRSIIHRFKNGNAPESDNVFQSLDFSTTWGLPYDSHPGPLKQTIEDAKTLNKSIIIFVYCRDSAVTPVIVNILGRETVSYEIQENMLFLPIDVTSPEGFLLATRMNFHELPLFLIVRPNGTSLTESHVFATFQGSISEANLLSYLRRESSSRPSPNNNTHSNTQDDSNINNISTSNINMMSGQEVVMQRDEIDDAYDRLLHEEYLRQHMEEEERNNQRFQEEVLQIQELSIQQAFDSLPPPPMPNEDRVNIKFQLGNITQIRAFRKESSCSDIYVFARKFMFPNDFVLKTGYPTREIPDNNSIISNVVNEKQFILHANVI